MPALGERFRAAREARGLSLSDVSEQIRIRSVYLAAIEDENWGAIGAPVYIRGFLRTYARFLGLDPEEVVASFNGAPIPSPSASPRGSAPAPEPSYIRATTATAEPAAAERSSGRSSLLIWVAGVIAVALVAYVVYQALTLPRGGSGSQTLAAASPVPSISSTGEGSAQPSALPSPTPADLGPNSMALTLTAPSWLRVTVDGSVSMEGTFPAGTSKTFHGKVALVRIGNAGGVQILVDGKDVGKLGNSGDVVERSFTL